MVYLKKMHYLTQYSNSSFVFLPFRKLAIENVTPDKNDQRLYEHSFSRRSKTSKQHILINVLGVGLRLKAWFVNNRIFKTCSFFLFTLVKSTPNFYLLVVHCM